MNARTDTERILDAFLAPESDRLADRVIDGALADIARTPQRRALRVPWRFPLMPASSRVTSIAAVALVAVVGAGALIYLNSRAPSGPGSPTTTVAPTVDVTPEPTSVAAGWTTYTSAAYGLTMSYPSDWSVAASATHKWQPGEPAVPDAWPWADVFGNPEEVDGDSMALWVWQMPAPAGSDLNSREGLLDVLREMCDESTLLCPTDDPPTPMCLGEQDCQPAIIMLVGDGEPIALFGDPESGLVTLFHIGRPDDFPAAARYGGTVALLKAILAQVDVRAPQPGETPH